MTDNEPDFSRRRRVSSLPEVRDAIRYAACHARRSLAILTDRLAHGVYDDPEFLEQIKRLARDSKLARVRVLIRDPMPAVKQGHRLVELGRRLSSFVEFRRVPESDRDRATVFMVADHDRLVVRPQASVWEGIADLKRSSEAREYLALFNSIWQHAQPEPELMQLKL